MKDLNIPRRRLCQLVALLLTNPLVGNFLAGKIWRGGSKAFCAPGLNCYSCPAAAFACPIGAWQAVGGAGRFGFYILGSLALTGLVLGRAVCGWLCPFGLLQEWLHKLPLPKYSLPLALRRLKYFALAVLVIIIPLWTGISAFCEYLCPAGTLEGGLPLLAAHEEYRQAAGWLFAWKFLLLLVVLGGCVLVYRLFCQALCPLGAVYGLFNRVSLWRLTVDKTKCLDCGNCHRACKLGLNPLKELDSPECIDCGECGKNCPTKAISWQCR